MGSHSAGRHSRQGAARPREARRPRDTGGAPYAGTAPWTELSTDPPAYPDAAAYSDPAAYSGRMVPARPPFAPPGEIDTITGPLSRSSSARAADHAGPTSPAGPPVGEPAGTGAARAVAASGSRGRGDSRFSASSMVVVRSSGAAAFTASQPPATVVQPTAGSLSTTDRAVAAELPDGQPARVPGAHRAPPVRRGSGRVRLVAAGTVSLAGLSALVAGVTLGGDPGAAATTPNAGDAPRVQYTGATGGIALGSAQTQASRDETRNALAAPPRAVLAPSPGHATTGAATHTGGTSGATGGAAQSGQRIQLGPGTAPIPIVTLTPRDDPASGATGPTDLRAIAPSPTDAITAAASSSGAGSAATATPSTGTSGAADGSGTPTATGASTAAGATGTQSDGSLPFHPIDVTPLLGSLFGGQSGAAPTPTAQTPTAPTPSAVYSPTAYTTQHATTARTPAEQAIVAAQAALAAWSAAASQV